MGLVDTLDQRVRRAFSNAAVQYDVLSSLHREIGRELSAQLRNDCISDGNILDIGMGTGWFSNRLKHFFPESNVIGIDLSYQMLSKSKVRAEDFIRLQANAKCLPTQDNSFDLITSNLVFQWMDDLSCGFKECYRSLKQDGALTVTMFGRETFRELFESLSEAYKQKDKTVPVFRRLANIDQVRQSLEMAGFKEVDVDYERIRVRYPDMLAILKWIKDIGANAVKSPEFLGKDLLTKANEHYVTHFKDRLGVYTTFEVIWVKAKK